MEGWFKFERNWLENGVITKDNDHLIVFVYLCAKAAYEPVQTTFGKDPVVLQPGQLITGRRRIATACHISDSKVTRTLALFEKAGIIRQDMAASCRMITLCRPVFDPEANRGRTTSEPEVNRKRTTGEPRANTNKECKNDKNERAKNTRACAQKAPWNQNVFCSDASYDLSAFMNHAIGMRPCDK